MVTRLSILHSKLANLRKARARVRRTMLAATAVFAVGVSLLVIFALDFFFDMQGSERGIVILLAAGGILWALLRYCRPFLGVQESEIDIALAVERAQRIDSDLVAALQF